MSSDAKEHIGGKKDKKKRHGPCTGLINKTHAFCSIQFKMVSKCSEKPIKWCAPLHVSEFSPTLPLKQFQCWFDWWRLSLVLSRKIVEHLWPVLTSWVFEPAYCATGKSSQWGSIWVFSDFYEIEVYKHSTLVCLHWYALKSWINMFKTHFIYPTQHQFCSFYVFYARSHCSLHNNLTYNLQPHKLHTARGMLFKTHPATESRSPKVI